MERGFVEQRCHRITAAGWSGGGRAARQRVGHAVRLDTGGGCAREARQVREEHVRLISLTTLL